MSKDRFIGYKKALEHYTCLFKKNGAMNYFKKNGLKVPEDIAVIGFSNWKISALTSPSLSSVEQNSVKMGKKVIELFIKTQKENKEEKKEFKTIKIPTKICLRESSMRTKT